MTSGKVDLAIGIIWYKFWNKECKKINDIPLVVVIVAVVYILQMLTLWYQGR